MSAPSDFEASPLPDEEFSKRLTTIYDTLTVQARRIVGPDKVEDAVQEAVLLMWKRRDSYREGNFAGWAYRCLRNTCLDVLSHPGAFQKNVVLVEDYEKLPAAPAQPLVVGGEVSSEEALGDQLREMMELYLPPKLSLVVKLRLKGYTSKEIAKLLSLSEGAARWRYLRGLKLLRQYLAQAEQPRLPR